MSTKYTPRSDSLAAQVKKVQHHQPDPLPFFTCLTRLPANVLPGRSAVLRPGALDFQHIASRGYRC